MSEPTYPHGIAYLDGRYVPMADAKISVLDWGFLRSDANQDTISVWKGLFFRLEDHLDRFARNVAKLRLTCPYDRDEQRAVLMECVRRSGLRDAYVEMTCTRGVPAPGSRDPRTCTNRFLAFAIPFVWILDPDKQVKIGLSVSTEYSTLGDCSFNLEISHSGWVRASTTSPHNNVTRRITIASIIRLISKSWS